MTFAQLTRADAEKYRARIEADHEPRLAELARLLTEAGVDLAALDGTPDSLVPLWQWALDVVDHNFDFMPVNPQFRRMAVHAHDADVPAQGHLSELLAHYLFEVALHCFDEVSWRVLVQRGFADHQKTVMVYRDRLGNERTSYPLDYCYNVLWTLDEPGARAADYLRTAALKGTLWCPDSERERIEALPRGTSVLSPYLWTNERTLKFQLEREAQSDDPPPTDDGLVGDELLLARAGSRIENLERARPIDAQAVADTLASLGFIRLDGATPTVDGILASEFSEFVRGEEAMAITLAWQGKLRAVQLSSIRAYPVPWAELVGEFTALGERIGAKLAREDEI